LYDKYKMKYKYNKVHPRSKKIMAALLYFRIIYVDLDKASNC